MLICSHCTELTLTRCEKNYRLASNPLSLYSPPHVGEYLESWLYHPTCLPAPFDGPQRKEAPIVALGSISSAFYVWLPNSADRTFTSCRLPACNTAYYLLPAVLSHGRNIWDVQRNRIASHLLAPESITQPVIYQAPSPEETMCSPAHHGRRQLPVRNARGPTQLP